MDRDNRWDRIQKAYKEMTEEQKDLLDLISPLNLEARYLSQKKEIIQVLTQSKCKEIIDKTEEMMLWIKNKLEN